MFLIFDVEIFIGGKLYLLGILLDLDSLVLNIFLC